MVLRGTKTSPDEGYTHAKHKVSEAREQYARAHAELLEAEKHVESLQATRDELGNKSKAELVKIVLTLEYEMDAMRGEMNASATLFGASEMVDRILRQLACGGCAGAISRTFVAPIDRVKILLQTQHVTQGEGVKAPKYSGVSGTFKKIVAEEGLLKLWRGNGTNVLRVLPYSATQFTSYDQYKAWMEERVSTTNEDGSVRLTVPQRLLCGAAAGMTATTITHPLDVIRVRLATDPSLSGMGAAFRQVSLQGAWFRGWSASVLSLGPFIGINFACFDSLKAHYFPDYKVNPPPKSSTLLLGAGAGILASSICFPLDTIRRRMQVSNVKYTGVANCISTILSEEGPAGFYKGVLPNVIKIVPNNAIRFLAYETLLPIFGAQRK